MVLQKYDLQRVKSIRIYVLETSGLFLEGDIGCCFEGLTEEYSLLCLNSHRDKVPR